MRRYEITDQQWLKIAQLLPDKVGDVGRSATDNRLFINAVLWIARSGAPWRDLPERFGPWKRSGVPVGLSPISTLGKGWSLAKYL